MRTSILVLCAVLSSAAFGLTGPTLKARSAIVIDADSGKVLFGKNANLRSFPASTTKIMTALLLIERCGPDELIKAPSDVERVTGSSMHLKPGETVPASDMLYALMLRSANDGAYATALHIAGSVPAFARMMNQRAKEIGCTHTRFTTPHGLKDPKHTTTARDLALIAREAMKYPEFRAAVGSLDWSISRSINMDDLVMTNKNKLLLADSTIEGIKTGYTAPAGYCFVGAATRDGYRLISVVLKSKDWQEDTKTLLDWAFKNHERVLVKSYGEPIQRVPVVGGVVGDVAVGADRDVYVTMPRGATTQLQFKVQAPDVLAPVQEGQRVGSILVTEGSGHRRWVAALALQNVPQRTAAHALLANWSAPTLGGLLLGSAMWMRGRARRRLRFYGAESQRAF